MRVANNVLSTVSGIDVQVTNEVTVCVLQADSPLEDGATCGDADDAEGEYATSFGCISVRVFGCTSL
jgi:hypothetical protein